MTSTDAVPIALLAWFVLTALSVAYVGYDAFRRTPEMLVMKWGWLLVTLYLGPVGGALYVLSCQEPRAGAHEDFVRPLWKQALGSSVHCLAGDATGIIVAAAVTMALGLRMWQDLVAEYVFGFAFGLLVFQAFFMREMLGGSYREALRRSFLPEWFSMNAVMAGMVPVMVVLMTRDMRSMEPGSLRFWGVMSLSTLAGLVVAYPVNVWLVAVGLKHGMGTVRVLGEGGHTLAAERGQRAKGSIDAAQAMPVSHGMAAAPAALEESRLIPTHDVHGPSPAVRDVRATRAQVAAVGMLTCVLLGTGVLIAALSGDLTMSGRMGAHTSAPGSAGQRGASESMSRMDMSRQ